MEIIETEICLIGLGPAGIGFLHKANQLMHPKEIICIEAGPVVQERGCVVLKGETCDFKPVCQVIGGFGGSSLMAGGKLSSYPAGMGLEEVVKSDGLISSSINEAKSVYESFLTLKEQEISPTEIIKAGKLYESKGFSFKHYYSSLYTQEEFLQANFNLQETLLKQYSILFNVKVIEITQTEDIFYIKIISNSVTNIITAKKIIFAAGKSGSELLQRTQRNLKLPCKPNKIEIGLRIEFPMEAFPEIDRHHYDLKLKRNGCKTFCISKGGKIALYLKDGLLYTEGYDNFLKQTEYTNLGFLYSLTPDKFDTSKYYSNLVAERKQKKIFKPIRQNYFDFLNHITTNIFTSGSSISCFQNGDINEFLIDEVKKPLRDNLEIFINSFIDKKYHSDINIFFPELNYGGLNFELTSSFECVKNFYLIGECSGKFIGILQAFASGMICAEKIKNEE